MRCRPTGSRQWTAPNIYSVYTVRLRQRSDFSSGTLKHWTYPADASVLPLSLDRYGLRYESSEGAKGYKIVVEQGQKAGTVLFEQQSFGSPRPQVH